MQRAQRRQEHALRQVAGGSEQKQPVSREAHSLVSPDFVSPGYQSGSRETSTSHTYSSPRSESLSSSRARNLDRTAPELVGTEAGQEADIGGIAPDADLHRAPTTQEIVPATFCGT
jgi:hypothetical protein